MSSGVPSPTDLSKTLPSMPAADVRPRDGRIKCVVWDLDDTLWRGILLEDGVVTPHPWAVDVVRELDRRGILNSIASKNDPQAAMDVLSSLGLADFFVYPQIGWDAKSGAVARVAAAINVSFDAVAFVDDQEFERSEVAFAHPEVLCVAPDDVVARLETPEFTPRFITDESRHRRAMFSNQIAREAEEQTFAGTPEEFLRELNMVFSIRSASASSPRRRPSRASSSSPA